MKSVSRIALGLALSTGAAIISVAPASAQYAQPQPVARAQAQTPPSRDFKFSKAERAALAPVQTAIEAKDFATAAAALPAAVAAAEGPDAKFIVGQFRLKIGLGLNDAAQQSAGIDAMIASGGAQPSDLAILYSNQASLAANAGDNKKAELALTRLVELEPKDIKGLAALAEVKIDLGKNAEALGLFDRAFAAMTAAGQTVPENWYKRALKTAYDGKIGAQTSQYSRALIGAYPTPQNWRDALVIYRETSGLDEKANLDLLRLMRASKSLSGERDYYELAEALSTGGLPGETKAVLDEGIAARMIDGNKAAFKDLLRASSAQTSADKASLAGEESKAMAGANGTLALNVADAYLGYGNYAKAIPLYRAALTKGSVDANLVNTRLGMALAMAGQKAEAEAAFKAVTGSRAQLASYWMLWLSQRG